MSVIAHSPFSGTKRLFDGDASPERHPLQAGLKRARFVGSSPSGRCLPAAAGFGSSGPHQQPVHPSAVQTLRGLFPQMDEQTVTSVLAECGSDIDAAIRRLTDLNLGNQLPSPEQLAAAKEQQAKAPGGATTPMQHQPRRVGSTPVQGGACAPPTQQQLQQQQQPCVPQSAQEWTDALVQEMAAARDVPDAKARAAKLLQAFEAFVAARAAKAPPPAGCAAPAGDGDAAAVPPPGGGVNPQQRLDEALRENVILKRAVAIQNARMHEAVAARDVEVRHLQLQLAAALEKAKALEMSNYSLAVHLQMATGAGGAGSMAPGHRPPDVY